MLLSLLRRSVGDFKGGVAVAFLCRQSPFVIMVARAVRTGGCVFAGRLTMLIALLAPKDEPAWDEGEHLQEGGYE